MLFTVIARIAKTAGLGDHTGVGKCFFRTVSSGLSVIFLKPGRDLGRGIMATVREVTFDLLRSRGMTTIFGNPGSTELPFLKDFPEDFSYVLGLHEATALGMADGYAQGTGRAALVNLHTAPGLGNAMGAMVTAYHNKTPLVVTAGQQDRRHVALEPLLTGKLVELAEPYVKRSHEPARAEDVPGEIQRAYHTAMRHPRGPVFVSIPMDDWEAEVEPPDAREVFYASAPDPEGLKKVAEALRGAHRPAIVAGAGVARTHAFGDVVELAQKLKAAVWEAPFSSLIGFPQDHPLFRGQLPFVQKQLAERLSPHDVVLVLGAPVFTYYPYVPGPTVEEGTQVFQISEDPEDTAQAAVGTGLVGDIGMAVRGLADLLPEADRTEPPAQEEPPIPEATAPISVDYLMHVLSEVLPEATVVVDEATSSKPKLHEHVRVNDPVGYHTSAAGGLGFGMPASVGLKLALPERPVVCVIGDGSSMYSFQALWSAARYGANVAFVVVNNRGYSILKGFRDDIGAGDEVPGLDVPGINFVEAAKSLGCEGETVEEAQHLRGALTRAFDAGRPYLVDVVVSEEVPRLLG
jgi:benzoylformate decarboxylase